MKLIKTDKTDFYQFEKLTEYTSIKQFISTNIRRENQIVFNDFDISLESGKENKFIISNRKTLSESVKIPLENFVMQNQIHGTNVKVISNEHKSKGIYIHSDSIQDNDAMITNIPGICLFLFAADCVPLLFYDPIKKVIGAAHSGWQGTVKKIAQKTVRKMKEVYASSFDDIIVGVGPSISLKNYEIGENVLKAGQAAFGTMDNYFLLNKKTGKYHFDLWYANKKQLIDIGIKVENIEIANMCTFDNSDIFFSARKNNTGRFGAGIMISR